MTLHQIKKRKAKYIMKRILIIVAETALALVGFTYWSQGKATESTAVTLCKHIRKGQKIVTDNASYLASMTGDHGED